MNILDMFASYRCQHIAEFRSLLEAVAKSVYLDKEDLIEIIKKAIYKIIKNRFNLEIPVFIMTTTELEDALKYNPDWWGTDNKEIYDNLIFIIPPTKYEEVYNTIGEPSKDIEKIEEYNNYIFWSFDLKKYKKANWWIKTASTDIKDRITIRTANTMKKVLEICKR